MAAQWVQRAPEPNLVSRCAEFAPKMRYYTGLGEAELARINETIQTTAAAT